MPLPLLKAGSGITYALWNVQYLTNGAAQCRLRTQLGMYQSHEALSSMAILRCTSPDQVSSSCANSACRLLSADGVPRGKHVPQLPLHLWVQLEIKPLRRAGKQQFV